MSEATCDEVRELAPELALGIAAGEQRARALVHMASCTECRTLIEELSRAADSLLLLGPAKEPPVGFEAQAVGRVRGLRPRRKLRIAAAFAAAVIVSVGATAVVMNAAGTRDRDLAERYLAILEGKGELNATDLVTSDGGPAGQVYAYSGATNWLFIVVSARSGTGFHDVVLIPKDAGGFTIGTMRIVDGRGSWGSTTAFDLNNVQVQLVPENGRAAYEATFRP